jgi:hypothetical protein
MHRVISAWRTGLLTAACLLGVLPARNAFAADKPARPRPRPHRPGSFSTSPPAGVIVSAPQPFTDGWEKIARMPENFAEHGKFTQSTVKVTVKQGWLQATRETDQGEREWQIVLAEVVPGDEPPEIEVDSQQDDFRLSYRGGRYCIRETWGELRAVRQRKGTQPWPRLTLPEADEGTHVQKFEPPQDPTLVLDCWWDKRFSNSWIVFSTGPASDKLDCLVRLNHSVLFAENDSRQVYTNVGVSHAVSGAKQVIDDGEILVAERLGEGDARREMAEHAGRERLVGAPAPELSSDEWLNHDGPLTWPDLKGRVVLLDFWISTQARDADVVHLPRLRELHADYAAWGLTIVGVFRDRTRHERNLERFLREERIGFPVMVDRGGNSERYFVPRHPLCVLVDRDGKVTWSGPRPPTNEQIEQLIGNGAASPAK